MAQETIIISKKEYIKLKEDADINADLIEQLISSLRDVKEGRIRRII